MNVPWQKYICTTPDVLHGRPRIKGTRIPVSLILGYLAEGVGIDGVLQEYSDLTADHIAACLDYARELAEFQVAA